MTGILVIEDESSVAGALKVILEDEGYFVRVAASGRDGLGLARRHSFDVVICDYRLPDINGIDLLKAISIINPSGSTILITAYDTPELIAEARACGIQLVLSKPFNPSQILTLLSSLV